MAEQQRILGVLDEAFAGLATAQAHAAQKLTALAELKKSLVLGAFSGNL